MSSAAQAVLLNGLPLLCLAAASAVVAASLLPAVWRGRADAHPLDAATSLLFAAVALSAAALGILVLIDRRPLAGHLWFSCAAIVVLCVPAVFFLALWRERGLLSGVRRRARVAEERVSLLDREFEAVTAITNALARAVDAEAASLPLVRKVCELLQVDFAAVAVIDEGTSVATGVVAEQGGQDVAWWRDFRLDLRSEPSGIASAVFDAAPVAIYDVQGSSRVSPKLVERVGARSGLWVPMIAEERVVGVLVVVTTGALRTFTPDETALLHALAGETALALDRMRSSNALAAALQREQLAADLARRIRAELDADDIVRVATSELRSALALDEVEIELLGTDVAGTPIVLGGSRIGTVSFSRAAPLDGAERFLLDGAAEEIGLALQTAALLRENERRVEQHSGLLRAAQVLTSELDLDAVLPRLVQEAADLLGADAADCYLLDPARDVLRCAAVHGLDPELVGYETPRDEGAMGLALRRGRPILVEDYDEIAQAPHEGYRGFADVLIAPMVWRGETRGVLGVGIRNPSRKIGEDETSFLEAFTSLAALALQNAELYGERARQARVQRAFHRISSLLSERLALPETLAAAARAATEALGGDFGAVLMPVKGRLVAVAGHALPDSVRSLPLAQVLVEAVADRQLLMAPRIAEDNRFGQGWRDGPFASLLAIPIESVGPGAVVVFYRELRSFTDDDSELASQLAFAAGGAFERSRLYESERTARSLSQRLARTASMLTAALDPEAVLGEVVRQAMVLVGADASTVALLQGDELVIGGAGGEGLAAARVIGLRAPAAGWHGGEVIELRAPVSRDDLEPDADPGPVASTVVSDFGFRAYAGVPLAAREGAVRGVLAVYGAKERQWRDEEIEALSALAATAAVALSNAELYRRIALEHEQSAAILSSIAEGIVAVDRDGRVVVWNAAAVAITGVPAEEAVGRTPAEVIQRDLGSDEGEEQRLVTIARGDEELALSVSETVMHDPAGGVAGRVFAFRDISAESGVEKLKSDFVSTVSHELRTPLTSIYGFAETLLRNDVAFSEPERRTFLGYIASESSRLTAIVDALLDVARIDKGELRVTLGPTDVGEVIADSLATADGASNGHRFEVDLDEGELGVQADPDKLRQVLDQLVENAVKFSPGGGVVRIEARRRPGAVEVSVTDQGIGIPLADRDRIFEKFHRGGEDVTGPGLGLFIARGLVSAMGGRLRLDAGPRSGSRFTFDLPAGREE
jgi:PAS domain S-box-containing protein